MSDPLLFQMVRPSSAPICLFQVTDQSLIYDQFTPTIEGEKPLKTNTFMTGLIDDFTVGV